jgi:phosphoesterase RecJ-like protein
VWNEDGLPEKFTCLPEAALLLKKPAQTSKEFDLLIALDTSAKNRLGTVLDAAGSIANIINIDHHVSNERFGRLNYVDANMPATGQILFEFFTSIGVKITPAMAGNLFAAIATDTGSFQYYGTSPRTFEAAAALQRAGANVSELSIALWQSQPRRRINLLRHVLNNAEFFAGDRAVAASLTLEEARAIGVKPEDTEGIMDSLRAVSSVVVSVFFEELEDGRVRVSSRSKDPRADVCKMCQNFGGGGHPLASGARMPGPIAAAREKFMKVVCNELSSFS